MIYRFCVCKDKTNFPFRQINFSEKTPSHTLHAVCQPVRGSNHFIAATTISARSRTSLFVPRPMAFLQSGQAVTITSAPVASSCAATDRAICTCWPSEMAVLATEEPQQRAFSRVEAGSSNSPTASITARGSS